MSLVLKRGPGTSVYLFVPGLEGEIQVKISISRTTPTHATMHIDAPQEVQILREELLDDPDKQRVNARSGTESAGSRPEVSMPTGRTTKRRSRDSNGLPD